MAPRAFHDARNSHLFLASSRFTTRVFMPPFPRRDCTRSLGPFISGPVATFSVCMMEMFFSSVHDFLSIGYFSLNVLDEVALVLIRFAGNGRCVGMSSRFGN